MLKLLNVTLVDEAVAAGRVRQVSDHVFEGVAHALLLRVDTRCNDFPVAEQVDLDAAAHFLQADVEDFGLGSRALRHGAQKASGTGLGRPAETKSSEQNILNRASMLATESLRLVFKQSTAKSSSIIIPK